LSVLRIGQFGQVKLSASDTAVDIEDIIACRLKVRSGIIRRRDEDTSFGTIVNGFENVIDGDEALKDRANGVKGDLQLGLRITSLDSGTANVDELALGSNVVCMGHAAHIHVIVTTALVARNDNLGRSESLVWGMGWFAMQMARTAWPTFLTLSGKYEGSPTTTRVLATSPSLLTPATWPASSYTIS